MTGSGGVDAIRENQKICNLSQVWISGSHSCDVLEYSAVKFSKNSPTFRRNLLSPSSLSKRKA
jgi:hypothetical protein